MNKYVVLQMNGQNLSFIKNGHTTEATKGVMKNHSSKRTNWITKKFKENATKKS